MRLDSEEVIIHDISITQEHFGASNGHQFIKSYSVNKEFYVVLNNNHLSKQTLLRILDIAEDLKNDTVYICIKKKNN